jgi:hypothetical protein
MSVEVARCVNQERALLPILTAAKLAAPDFLPRTRGGQALFPTSCVTLFWADEEPL